jgi:hypothetical protein
VPKDATKYTFKGWSHFHHGETSGSELAALGRGA